MQRVADELYNKALATIYMEKLHKDIFYVNNTKYDIDSSSKR